MFESLSSSTYYIELLFKNTSNLFKYLQENVTRSYKGGFEIVDRSHRDDVKLRTSLITVIGDWTNMAYDIPRWDAM